MQNNESSSFDAQSRSSNLLESNEMIHGNHDLVNNVKTTPDVRDMNKKNVRSFFNSENPSTLLRKSFSYIIDVYLQFGAEEGCLILSPWTIRLIYEKDETISGFLNRYHYLMSKWSTELDFCDTNQVIEIDTFFENEMNDLLLSLVEHTEAEYGPVYI